MLQVGEQSEKFSARFACSIDLCLILKMVPPPVIVNVSYEYT